MRTTTAQRFLLGVLGSTLLVACGPLLGGCAYLDAQMQRTALPDDRIELGWQDRLSVYTRTYLTTRARTTATSCVATERVHHVFVYVPMRYSAYRRTAAAESFGRAGRITPTGSAGNATVSVRAACAEQPAYGSATLSRPSTRSNRMRLRLTL
jgi:hypothetical protein